VPKIQMSVIPEPTKNSASIIENEPNFAHADPYTLIRGSGDTDYLCGACRVPLAISASQGKIINIVLKCGKCSSYNAIRGTKL